MISGYDDESLDKNGGDVTVKKVTLSLSYTGKMNPDNKKMSQGTLKINATDEEGNVTTLSSYTVDSGPSGVGSIPNDTYTASRIDPTSQHGMVRKGVGFKVTLNDNTGKCRDALRIHPDGEETPGTSGCIGLVETKTRLVDFQTKMTEYLKDGATLKVNVNITGNPNLSDCDVNGNKKTHDPHPGN